MKKPSSQNLLLCGATGMLGQAILRQFKKEEFQIYTLARKQSDFNIDLSCESSLIEVLERVQPDIIINAAAIVDLKFCEENPATAYLVNSRPLAVLTEYAIKNNKYLIHISTDHFYKSEHNIKHDEKAQIRLVNEYARTKYLGEQYASIYKKNLIIRTNIVGFRNTPEQPTFVEWVIQTLKSKEKINLFRNVYTSSIAVSQFTYILHELLLKRANGIFNIASRDTFSKEAFIIALADRFELSLDHATSVDYKNEDNLKRAINIGLKVDKAENYLGYNMPTMTEVIEQLYFDYRGVSENEI